LLKKQSVVFVRQLVARGAEPITTTTVCEVVAEAVAVPASMHRTAPIGKQPTRPVRMPIAARRSSQPAA
jgi:hypothetical protein